MSGYVNNWSDLLAFAAVMSTNQLYETRLENDIDGNILYVGTNQTPNASVDDSTWFITKLSYDGGGFLERVQLPDTGLGFIYAWADRASFFS